VIKFWLALILGTISISAGLTYLKLHKGAQTISYPPPAPKTKPAIIDFISTSPNNDDVSMEISANVVTFKVRESKADKENQVSFKIHNTGEGTLDLSLEKISPDFAKVYIDQQQLTPTDHQVKISPGKTSVVTLQYKPKLEIGKKSGEKLHITTTFTHNDERYSDNLHFDIETSVK
jgi:hypothetical protein